MSDLRQAAPVQEPFDDLATELFVVAQISPADDGFSDTIDRIESWLREHFSAPPQRKPLTKGEIEIILSRHYMYTEDLIRAIEAAHSTKEGT